MATMRYLYFPGCKLTPFLPGYDRSTRAVLSLLDIELDDVELNCCGYPVRHIDFTASMHAGARILAIASRKGLPILTPCKCCFGNLKQADFWMRRHAGVRDRVNGLLQTEDLHWSADVTVRHLLNALSEDVGLARVRDRVRHPLNGLKVAAHYGCHALRPGDVTQFDNPLAPSLFERVVAATGARPVEWPLRLDCCGHPQWEKNDRLALALMQRKLADAHDAGADLLATACTYCQLQFERVRAQELSGAGAYSDLPAVLVTGLLGTAMGLPADVLGLSRGPSNAGVKQFT